MTLCPERKRGEGKEEERKSKKKRDKKIEEN